MIKKIKQLLRNKKPSQVSGVSQSTILRLQSGDYDIFLHNLEILLDSMNYEIVIREKK